MRRNIMSRLPRCVSVCRRRYRRVSSRSKTHSHGLNCLHPTMSTLTSSRILVVDDDPDLRDLLRTYLGANGFDVQTAGDGVAMRAALDTGLPDVIVLDLMLPGEDGLSLTRSLRTRSSVPILMLSARGEEMDRVIGLEVGTDDYLAKPFGPRELLARLRALLRRRQTTTPEITTPEGYPHFGPYSLDSTGRRLLREGLEVQLTSAAVRLGTGPMCPQATVNCRWVLQKHALRVSHSQPCSSVWWGACFLLSDWPTGWRGASLDRWHRWRRPAR